MGDAETRYFIGVTASGLRVSTVIGPARFRSDPKPLPMSALGLRCLLGADGVDPMFWPVDQAVYREWASDEWASTELDDEAEVTGA